MNRLQTGFKENQNKELKKHIGCLETLKYLKGKRKATSFSRQPQSEEGRGDQRTVQVTMPQREIIP